MQLPSTHYFKPNHTKIKYLLTIPFTQTVISTMIATKQLLKNPPALCIYNFRSSVCFSLQCMRYTQYMYNLQMYFDKNKVKLKRIRISAVYDTTEFKIYVCFVVTEANIYTTYYYMYAAGKCKQK